LILFLTHPKSPNQNHSCLHKSAAGGTYYNGNEEIKARQVSEENPKQQSSGLFSAGSG
jgi:hypothetical protein